MDYQQSPSSQAPQQGSPWFAVSAGLAGIIVGFGLGMGVQGTMNTAGSAPAPSAVPAPTAQVPTPPAPQPTNETPATVDDDEVLGDEDATVAIIEFTDYQCPFCARHYTQTFGQIKSDYIDTGKVQYVVRDFPLSFHNYAQKSAEATECAADQGKFWEMHEKLFANQATWGRSADAIADFKQYASELELNQSTFDDCLDGGTHAQEAQKDMADGQSSGVSGTPGFWIVNLETGKGQRLSGAQPYNAFKTAIDAQL